MQGKTIFADTRVSRLSSGDNRHNFIKQCQTIRTDAGPYDVKIYYWVHRRQPFLDITYNGPDTNNFAQPLRSISAGICSADGAHRCFPAAALDNCQLEFRDETLISTAQAGSAIAQLEWTFTLGRTLQENQYVSLVLGGFERSGATKADFDFHTIEIWESGAVKAEAEQTQPHVSEYTRIGCFRDGLEFEGGRVLGGGTCKTFRDATKIVQNREQCYRHAAAQGHPGFCMSRQSECFTAPVQDFDLSIGMYSYSDYNQTNQTNQTGCGTTGNGGGGVITGTDGTISLADGTAGFMDCYRINTTGTLSSSTSSSFSSPAAANVDSNASNVTAYTPFVPTGEDAGAVVTEIGRLCGETKCGRVLPGIDAIAFVSPINITAGTRLRIVARNIGISVNIAGLAGGTSDETIGLFSSVVDPSVELGVAPKALDVMWGTCVTPAIAPPPPVTAAQPVPAGETGSLVGPTLAINGTAIDNVKYETDNSSVGHTCDLGLSITMGLENPGDVYPTAPNQRLAGASVLLDFNCGTATGLGELVADGYVTCPVTAAAAASAIAAQSSRRRLGSNEIILSETADGVPARRLLTVDGSGRMYYRGRRLSIVKKITTVDIGSHWYLPARPNPALESFSTISHFQFVVSICAPANRCREHVLVPFCLIWMLCFALNLSLPDSLSCPSCPSPNTL